MNTHLLASASPLLTALIESRDPELLDNYIARSLIEHKWRAFGRSFFLRSLWPYVMMLLIQTSLSFVVDWTNPQSDGIYDYRELTKRSITIGVLYVLGLMLTVYYVFQESREIVKFRQKYFVDVWNHLDLGHIALHLVFSVLFLFGASDARAVLSIALYLRWIGVFYFLQPFSSTGPLVRMVLVILQDMRHFLLFLSIVLCATWLSLRLLTIEQDAAFYGNTSELNGPGDGLLLIFNLLILSEFDMDVYSGHYVVIVRLLFVINMVLVPVVLLNLLIALMSDSYERIQDRAEIEFQYLRAQIIHHIEAFLPVSVRVNEEYFPRWVHVAVPVGSGIGQVATSIQWQGVLNALKGRIACVTSLQQQQDAKLALLHQQQNVIQHQQDVKLTSLHQQQDIKLTELQRQQNAMQQQQEERLVVLTEKIDRMLQTMSNLQKPSGGFGFDEHSQDVSAVE